MDGPFSDQTIFLIVPAYPTTLKISKNIPFVDIFWWKVVSSLTTLQDIYILFLQNPCQDMLQALLLTKDLFLLLIPSCQDRIPSFQDLILSFQDQVPFCQDLSLLILLCQNLCWHPQSQSPLRQKMVEQPQGEIIMRCYLLGQEFVISQSNEKHICGWLSHLRKEL